MKTLFTAIFAATSAFTMASWSTFHGDNQRTGRTTQTLDPSMTVSWTADMLGKVIVSPVIAQDGTIYVGPVLTKEKKPRLLMNAINPDGTIKWRFTCKFVDDQTKGCPAIDAQGNVYFGTSSGVFYSLNPNGQVRWTYTIPEAIESIVLVGSDGNIYARVGPNNMSFTPNGVVRWSQPAGVLYGMGFTETLQGNYCATTSNGTTCFSSNGTVLWSAPTSHVVCPTITPSGQVLVQSGWFSYINPLTGTIDNYSTGSSLYGTFSLPAIDSAGNLYFPETYNLYRFNSQGVQTHGNYFEVGTTGRLAQTWSCPVVDAAGKIYMGAGTISRSDLPYEMSLFRLSSSMIVQATTPMGQVAGTSSPAVGNQGQLYMGSLDGMLYCFQ